MLNKLPEFNLNRTVEDDFILNSASVNLTDANVKNLKRLSGECINWNLLESKANLQMVSNIIYYSLKNHNLSNLVPGDIFNRFREKYYETAVSNSFAIRGIDILSEIIKDKIVLLKGSDLIQSLYPDIGIRSMCDIDILVERNHVKKIWNNLLVNGFHVKSKSAQPPKSEIHKRYSESEERHLPPLYSDISAVELHWNLFRGEKLHRITEIAFEKSRLIKNNIYHLSVEMSMIFLCNHFCCHLKRNANLRMLCDINELLLKYENEINWEEISNITSGTELKGDVSTSLTYAYAMLQTPVPVDFLDNKLLLNEKYFYLGSALKQPGKEVSHRNVIISRIKSFNHPSDKIIFVFRIFVPSKKWMNAKFYIGNNSELVLAYFKFWFYLINRHILKKELLLGNKN